MSADYFIGILLAGCILLLEIYLLIRSFINFFCVKNKKQFSDFKVENRISLLLPCYKEYEILEDTINYYYSIMKTVENADVYIIVGNEYSDGKRVSDNSFERLNKLITLNRKYSEIKVLFDDTEYSTKSTKLNFAVDYLEELDDKQMYIGVFDFDSRPDVEMIEYINKDISWRVSNKQSLPCSYQPISCIGNLKTKSIFVKLFSIWHYRRSFGIEGRKILSQKKKIRYCNGSCVFLLLDDVIKANKFELYNDDILMGYKLQLLKKECVVIPYLTIIDSIESLTRGVSQYLRIYSGLFGYKNIIKKYGKDNLKLGTKFNYYTNILFDIFSESIQFVVFITILIINPLIFFITYLGYSMILLMYYFLFVKVTSKKMKFKAIPLGLLGCMVNIVFRTFVICLYKIKRLDKAVYFE